MQKIIYRIDVENDISLKDLAAECYILNSDLSEDFCRKFVQNASVEEKIVLFYGDDAMADCKKFEADGVVVDLGADDLKEKMTTLRKELGKNKFIGLFTRGRRHESMLVSEVEPDFIIFKVWKDGFEQIKELTDWYADFFLIQSAAWVVDKEAPVNELATDFVIYSIS